MYRKLCRQAMSLQEPVHVQRPLRQPDTKVRGRDIRVVHAARTSISPVTPVTVRSGRTLPTAPPRPSREGGRGGEGAPRSLVISGCLFINSLAEPLRPVQRERGGKKTILSLCPHARRNQWYVHWALFPSFGRPVALSECTSRPPSPASEPPLCQIDVGHSAR